MARCCAKQGGLRSATVEGMTGYQRLATAVAADRGELLAAWIRLYDRSPMRMPGAIHLAEVSAVVDHLFRSLTGLFVAPRGIDEVPLVLTPGASELREIEQAAAFLGANLSSTRATGFDVVALILCLRDVLCPLTDGAESAELASFIEWLSAVAVDSFSTARQRAIMERHREELEEGTPVVNIVPELPAAMLVGRPPRSVVDSVLSRLLLSAVRVGARALILDVSGLANNREPQLLEALQRFLDHRKLRGRTEVLVVRLAPEVIPLWKGLSSDLRFFEYFDQAVAEGLRAAGYRLVRSPTTGH